MPKIVPAASAKSLQSQSFFWDLDLKVERRPTANQTTVSAAGCDCVATVDFFGRPRDTYALRDRYTSPGSPGKGEP